MLTCLIDLHSKDLVHRNITFDSVAWKGASWGLTQTEHMTKVGREAPVPGRGYLQDPDQLRALQSGDTMETVRASVDVFAAGMLLWELVRLREAFFCVEDSNVNKVCCACYTCIVRIQRLDAAGFLSVVVFLLRVGSSMLWCPPYD